MTKRIKRPALPVPITREQAENVVGQIRMLKIRQMTVQAEREAKHQEVDKFFASELGSLAGRLDERAGWVQSWAEANPTLFEKRKSIEFTHGTVGFRTGTPKLALLDRKWNWEKVLEQVRRLLPAFIRDTPTIDKEAILAQRAEPALQFAIKGCGMKVVQDESFYVEPKIEEIETKESAPSTK